MKQNRFFTFISYAVLIVYMLFMLNYAIKPLVLPIAFSLDSKRLLFHFGELFLLGLLLFNATRKLSVTLFIGVIYGSILEIIQLWVPGRVFDFYDLGANILGLLTGLLTFSKIKAYFKK